MSIEAEQSVIGSLMLIGDSNSEMANKVMSMVKPSSFSSRSNREIYEAMVSLAKSGDSFDLITVESRMKSLGTNSDETFSYLAEVTKNTPSAANVMAYVAIVRQSAVKRTAHGKLQEAIAMLNDESGGDVYQRLGYIESMIADINSRAMTGKQGGLVHVSEIAGKWFDMLDQRFSNPESVSGFATGVYGVDRILGAKLIPKGSLVAIGARPKMGKTALMNMIATNFALNTEKAVAMFSLEMPSDQIFERMIAENARVDSSIFYKGADDDADFARVGESLNRYSDSKMYIDDTPGITIQHIQRESRKIARKEDVGLICVDYLTLMKADKADRNDLAYGEITKALKNLAKELDCVVLLLTQLNRSLESRPNKRPMPSDSRDTGQIEQDCDLWIGLYRDYVYNEDSPAGKELTEVIVRLNRHGGTGTAHLLLKNGYFADYTGPAVIGLDGNKVEDDDY